VSLSASTRFNISTTLTFEADALAAVKSAEDLRQLFASLLDEKTGGAVELLCANSDGVIAPTCDDALLDATVDRVNVAGGNGSSIVVTPSKVRPRTLVARTLSVLYADSFVLMPDDVVSFDN
jgi:hypothetical protein